MTVEIKPCPLCRIQAEMGSPSDGRDALIVLCERCGEFQISRTLLYNIASEDGSLLPYLSAYTRQQSESSGRAELNTSNWRGFAEAHLHTTVHQKLEKLLIVVERRTKWPGEYVTFKWNSDYPLIDAVTQEQAAYFIDHALKRAT